MRFLGALTLTLGHRALGCETGAARRAHGCAERGSRWAFCLSACAARRMPGRAARVNRWVPGRVARAVRSSGRAFRPGMRAHRRDAWECAAPLARQAAFWPGEGERAYAYAVRRDFRESRCRATLSLLGWRGRFVWVRYAFSVTRCAAGKVTTRFFQKSLGHWAQFGMRFCC